MGLFHGAFRYAETLSPRAFCRWRDRTAQLGETGLTAIRHPGSLDSTSKTCAMHEFQAKKTAACALSQATSLHRWTTTATHMVDCDSRRTSVCTAA